MTDKAQLAEVAEAAKDSPGPFIIEASAEMLEFVATFPPPVVLALLEENARVEAALATLRQRLRGRLSMAREVLDEQGYGEVAALIPLEEVLIWMDEVLGQQTEGADDQ